MKMADSEQGVQEYIHVQYRSDRTSYADARMCMVGSVLAQRGGFAHRAAHSHSTTSLTWESVYGKNSPAGRRHAAKMHKTEMKGSTGSMWSLLTHSPLTQLAQLAQVVGCSPVELEATRRLVRERGPAALREHGEWGSTNDRKRALLQGRKAINACKYAAVHCLHL